MAGRHAYYRVFRHMRQLHSKISLADVPDDLNPPHKRCTLIDFIACIPQTMTRACTSKGILHGFLENGMIDSNTKRYPDYDRMLATCRSDISEQQYNLCLISFPTLLKIILEKGHVPDSVFADLGFKTKNWSVSK
mmetsp:Transcript_4826/g.7450  ORF Transcript_4826/g.7450 Transcript_4826/m.7450 type:complete len:135 (-) Transcript_4826:532-936(-)